MRTLIFLSLLSLPAAAQNINIDVGDNLIIFPVPTTSYGAAANQPGVWNSSVHPYSTSLVDITGAATAATTTSNQSSSFNYFPSTLPDPSDDRWFMIDIQTLPTIGGPWNWTFNGLLNGDYALYTYAWAPENNGHLTRVTVAGSTDPAQNVGGVWTGSPHVAGITYALHHVSVTAGTISVQVEGQGFSGAVNGFQLVYTPAGTPSTPFCLGDGTGAACPCGNTGSIGNGCANSSFATGGKLTSAGFASVGTDTLVLSASNIPGPGLFFQSNGLVAPILFGDGHLCAAVGIIRMGVVFPSAGSASYPGGLTPNPISIAGAPIAAGNTKNYQCWYRDAVSFCTVDTFNLTNGVSLIWGP